MAKNVQQPAALETEQNMSLKEDNNLSVTSLVMAVEQLKKENQQEIERREKLQKQLNRERVRHWREKDNQSQNNDNTCLKEPITDELVQDAIKTHFTVNFLKPLRKLSSYDAVGQLIYNFICKDRAKLMAGQRSKNVRHFNEAGEIVIEPLASLVARICEVIKKTVDGPEFRSRDCYLLNQQKNGKYERKRIREFATMNQTTVAQISIRVGVKLKKPT